LMMAMTIMHQYHGGYMRTSGDPLPEVVRLYRIDAKAIEKRVKAATAEKLDAIQAALKKRKEKKKAGTARS
jgi:hypothetical protein